MSVLLSGHWERDKKHGRGSRKTVTGFAEEQVRLLVPTHVQLISQSVTNTVKPLIKDTIEKKTSLYI